MGCPPHLAAPSPDPNIDPKLARPLSAAKLLCRPLPSDYSSVPKLLHQSWKTNELPAKFEKWSRVCREKHHDWEWVLWTNDDNLNLVRKHFPWLEEAYLELPGEIYRADFSRNLYMYIFGGVYADLDTDCLRPTSAVFKAFDIPNVENTTAGADGNHINQFAVFGRMGTNENFDNSIPNAWMASSPGHPFFLMPPLSVRPRIAKSKSFIYWLFQHVSAEEWTGPVALYNAMLDFNTNGLSKEAVAMAAVGPFASLAKKTKQEIVLLPSHWIYPYDWNVKELRPLCSAEAETFDAKACQERLEVDKKGGISITYWSHTHDNKNDNAKNIDSLSNE
ncbi:hypothetical protein VC83_08003 [Pseudogymnoascus destructans]|uniref:Membrane-bound alpha-1,6-mannosyltransferase Initiation-specific n=1 Tax=Pseudogymnoascus destructans TaxID=655981 RepID=A0A177A1A8_9PEZI|nr:uncharacterized protein VC83_08003 [Pseudogymnoascus destructans]OAF55938.1 hypothetical protein VC83_08003 [Pseudogymnoascus destructans]